MVKRSELKSNRHGRIIQCSYTLKKAEKMNDDLCCGERLKGKRDEEEGTLKYESFCPKHTSNDDDDDAAADDVPVDQPVVTVTPKQIRVLRMVLDDLFPAHTGKEWTENIQKRKNYVANHPLPRRLLANHDGPEYADKHKFIVNTLASTTIPEYAIIKIIEYVSGTKIENEK